MCIIIQLRQESSSKVKIMIRMKDRICNYVMQLPLQSHMAPFLPVHKWIFLTGGYDQSNYLPNLNTTSNLGHLLTYSYPLTDNLFFKKKKIKKAGNDKYYTQSIQNQLVGHHFMCAWYCHFGQSMEGWKLAKKKVIAILLDHSFHIVLLPKMSLMTLDLYKQSNMTK